MEFGECYELCSMSCLGDGPIHRIYCSSMGYLHIERDPSTHMVATLDSSIDLSLVDDAHWPFTSFLVVD